jgi:CMP-N,N'-diacetyllegionaminic acid synthase
VSSASRMLAVIPARGGSKGLPGKNIRPFAGIPLVAHTIIFAKMCPEITRCIVSTDSAEFAKVAEEYGGDVPFLRPPELAQDETSVLPVLQHALAHAEANGDDTYDYILLLDPTSPAREPIDISGALGKLIEQPTATCIIGISEPEHNPVSHGVTKRDGWMVDLIDGASQYERRQEVPLSYQINGSLYIWRTEYIRPELVSWRHLPRQMMFEVPRYRSMSIDSLWDFQLGEALLKAGLIDFPWLKDGSPIK